jgi:hypothetical protein
MLKLVMLFATLAAAPAAAQPRHLPPGHAVNAQRAFPEPRMNVAGTTPQYLPSQMQPRPTLRERASNLVSRLRYGGRGH